jgi:molybdopterin synthase sulfur carrier subunit
VLAYLGFPINSERELHVRISVRFFTVLRELAGKGEDVLAFGAGKVTVNSVLQALAARHGTEFKDYLFNEQGKVREPLQLLVDGKAIMRLEGLETELKDGSQLAIIPPVSGG